MTEKPPKNSLETVESEYQKYSEMPFKDKIKELGCLKQRKQGLEKQMDSIDISILVLEDMPDVLEFKVTNNEMVMALLKELKAKGDISYNDLTRGCDEQIPYTHYLHLLNRAQFLETEIDPSNQRDVIIKLTERGRNYLFVEEGQEQ